MNLFPFFKKSGMPSGKGLGISPRENWHFVSWNWKKWCPLAAGFPSVCAGSRFKAVVFDTGPAPIEGPSVHMTLVAGSSCQTGAEPSCDSDQNHERIQKRIQGLRMDTVGLCFPYWSQAEEGARTRQHTAKQVLVRYQGWPQHWGLGNSFSIGLMGRFMDGMGS